MRDSDDSFPVQSTSLPGCAILTIRFLFKIVLESLNDFESFNDFRFAIVPPGPSKGWSSCVRRRFLSRLPQDLRRYEAPLYIRDAMSRVGYNEHSDSSCSEGTDLDAKNAKREVKKLM